MPTTPSAATAPAAQSIAPSSASEICRASSTQPSTTPATAKISAARSESTDTSGASTSAAAVEVSEAQPAVACEAMPRSGPAPSPIDGREQPKPRTRAQNRAPGHARPRRAQRRPRATEPERGQRRRREWGERRGGRAERQGRDAEQGEDQRQAGAAERPCEGDQPEREAHEGGELGRRRAGAGSVDLLLVVGRVAKRDQRVELLHLRLEALPELDRGWAQLGFRLQAGVDRVGQSLGQVGAVHAQGRHAGADPARRLGRRAGGDRVDAGPALIGGQPERVDVRLRPHRSPSACSGDM